MAWYEDLAPCDCFGAGHAARIRAVGWLSGEHAFATGPVDEIAFRQLCALTQDP